MQATLADTVCSCCQPCEQWLKSTQEILPTHTTGYSAINACCCCLCYCSNSATIPTQATRSGSHVGASHLKDQLKEKSNVSAGDALRRQQWSLKIQIKLWELPVMQC